MNMFTEQAAPNISKYLKITDPKDPLIPYLEAFLIDCSNTYYNTAKEVIDDASYDKLELILKAVKPKSKALQVRAPTVKKLKVRLPFKMGSLDKVNPAQGNVQRWLDTHPGSYVVSDKLDGSSIESVQTDGEWKDYSGGDGVIGGDISILSPFIKRPAKKFSKQVALRGEALVSRGSFQKYKGVFKNPRAMANGLCNTERLQKHVKDLDVIYYTVLSPTVTVSQGFEWLKANGFPTVPYKVYNNLTEQMLSKILTDRKAKSKYDLDGIVISQDVRVVNSVKNPDYAVAFKEIQASDVVQAIVTGIEWNVSAHGYLIPVVLIKPVDLFGTTVSRAAGKNAKMLFAQKIGKGAVVTITKGGEVIPDITGVVKPASEPNMPSEKEFGTYHWDKNGTHLVCDEVDSNDTVIAKRIIRFFSAMKIDGIKGATVDRLIEAGYDTILKIVRLTLEKMGEAIGSQKNAKTIYDSMVEHFGQADLAQFMDASGAFSRGFGSRRVEMIQKLYPDVLGLADMDKKKLYAALSEVNGIGPEMAKLFVEGIPKFVKWMSLFPQKLLRFKEKEVVKVSGSKLRGQSVIFTGVRSEETEQFILANGGILATSGKKATICLVKSMDTGSAKRQAAESVGAQIMTLESFQKKYMN